LDNLVDPPAPKVDVEIKEIEATDDDKLETLAEIEEWGKPKAHLLRRLAEGQHCYVAQHQSQIVACCWWLDGEFKDPTLDREFKLAANEVYMHSVFTAPAFRGKGILSYLDVQAGRDATRTQGKTRSLSLVEVTNKASLRSSAKGGRIRIGLVGFVEILGVRFHYFWGRNAFQETPRRFFVERR
jgi:GNAT superfamily N-acetyltransferase